MKKLVIQLFVGIFLLCCGFQAVAQTPITEFKEKRRSLSEEQFEAFNQLFSEKLGSIYVDENGQAQSSDIKGDQAKLMIVNHNEDFEVLRTTFSNQLHAVEAIQLSWNGQDDIILPSDLLPMLSGLRYIVVSSNQILNSEIVRDNLPVLLTSLSASQQVEVLYNGMEQIQ